MTVPAIEHVFETLNEAIVYAFRQEQTTLLSLDRICALVQSPNLFLNAKKEGMIPCSSIVRRRISSTLSSSELFTRAGPPRACLWAIRPSNPLFLSDGVISSSIEQMLMSSGPMTLEQFAQNTQLNGADFRLFERFLDDHSSEFARHPDSTYWFTGQPRPIQRDFESISHALAFALTLSSDGASVEELTWFLCLSTVNTFKTITRRNVSRELSRRTDLFEHLSRARYTLIANRTIEEPPAKPSGTLPMVFPPPPLFQVPQPLSQQTPFHIPHPQPPPFQVPVPPPPVYPPFTLPAPDPPAQRSSGPTGEEEFDPFSFFGHEFQFAFE
jgi:hypothetical protein